MRYAIIVGGSGGYRTITGDLSLFDLPADAETFDDADAFEARLAELNSDQ